MNCFRLPEFLIPFLVMEKKTLLVLAFIIVLTSELVSMGFCFQADISFLFSICYINRVNSYILLYRVPKSRGKQLSRYFSPAGVTSSAGFFSPAVPAPTELPPPATAAGPREQRRDAGKTAEQEGRCVRMEV